MTITIDKDTEEAIRLLKEDSRISEERRVNGLAMEKFYKRVFNMDSVGGGTDLRAMLQVHIASSMMK